MAFFYYKHKLGCILLGLFGVVQSKVIHQGKLEGCIFRNKNCAWLDVHPLRPSALRNILHVKDQGTSREKLVNKQYNKDHGTLQTGLE